MYSWHFFGMYFGIAGLVVLAWDTDENAKMSRRTRENLTNYPLI
jgi:hypothetical protein